MPLPPHYMTVVLELPNDPESRKPVLDALPLGGYFKGARVTAMAMGDTISELEKVEEDETLPLFGSEAFNE